MSKAQPNDLNLVSSRRLQALATGGQAPAAVKPSSLRAERGNDEQARLQDAVEQRLNDVLSKLPPGKAANLFRIRYGVDLAEFRALPLERAAALLGIGDALRNNRRGVRHSPLRIDRY